MKKLSLLSKKTISIIVSFSLVLSFIPTLGLSNVAQATEDIASSDAKTFEEIQETASGRLVPADEASKEALKGGVFHVLDRSDINYNVKDTTFDSDSLSKNRASETLPEKVDLRDFNGKNLVTSVKNQSATGTCWAFAANAASEVSVANSLSSSATADFSPFQTAYFAYDALSSDKTKLQGTEVSQAGEGIYWSNSLYKAIYALNIGGTTKQASSEFFSGVGVSKATDIPFPEISLSTGYLLSSLTQEQRRCALARLTKWSWLGSLINTTYDSSTQTTKYVSTNKTVLNNIKTEISKGNAVEISYCGDASDGSHEKYIDQDNKAQYTYEYQGSNHAVCVVGYDDTYPKTNFIEGHQPYSDGAFIVKNSWGSGWGKEGYFYLSYYDQSVSDAATYTYDTSSYDGDNVDPKKEIVDQYDYISAEDIYDVGINGALGNYAQWYSNVYTASQEQKLHSIGTYYCSNGQTLSYKVYKLKSDATTPSDVSGSLDSPDAEGTYTSEYEGFASIKLDSPVVLKEGEKYAIWISQKNDSGKFCAPQAISMTEVPGKDADGNVQVVFGTNTIVNSGESFYMPESASTWSGLSKFDVDGYSFDNYCVKGYATAMNVAADFVSNCDTAVPSQTVADGSKIEKPETPTKAGFTFDGWYTDSNFTTAYDFDKELTRNITLYAKWTATIDYVLNQGQQAADAPTSYVYTVGVSKLPTPTRTGYDFEGWWTKDGTGDDWGEQLTSIAADESRGNMTLHAKWAIHTYTITYNNTKDAPNSNPKDYTYESGTINLADLQKDGYNFLGWWSKDGTGDDWGEQITTIKGEDQANVTLYARWSTIAYNIHYNKIEGATNNNPSTYTIEDETIYLNNPEKPGYWCRGWYYKDGGTSLDNDDWGDSCAFIENGSTGDVTLYARWYLETYTITFKGVDGATNPNGDTIYYDIYSSKGTLQNASKDGFIFNGWFDASGNRVTEYGGGAIGDMELTAQWTEIKKHNVTFVDWDGTVIKSEKVEEGKAATAPETNPEREGHTFTGWSPADFSSVTDDMTITAQYSINKYTVKFVDWDSTLLKEQEVEWGSDATAPDNPTRDGFLFTGWQPEDFTNVTKSMTVVAQYALAHRVRFYTYDASEIIKEQWVEEGKDATPPDASDIPEREGYVFVGWSEVYTSVTANVNAVAMYQKVFTVTFYDDDGQTVLKTEKVKKGEAATPPENPTKSGYTFTGWDKDYSNVTQDLEVYPTWEEIVDPDPDPEPVDPDPDPDPDPEPDPDPVDPEPDPDPEPEAVTYSVVFNSNGGSTVATQTIESGKCAKKPVNPTRSGYTFAGWYADSLLTLSFNFSSAITANVTLYAKWTKDADVTPTPTPTPTPAVESSTMHRLYNKWTGEHFYTSDESEYKKLASGGWNDEGEGWNAPTSSSIPVYRLYNKYVEGGDHHYTMDSTERDNLVKAGWTYEGIGWYSDEDEGVPLYRQYNPYATVGTHNYTTSKDENDKLIKAGWRAEGISWYGVK